MKRKTIALVLVVMLVFSMGVPAYGAKMDSNSKGKEVKIESYGNEFEIGTYDEFMTGTEFNNTTITNSVGDGAITLDKVKGDYSSEGSYVSQIIDVPNFEYMVLSWNSDTPPGTYVEVEARVLVNHFNENGESVQTWSDFLSWGKWSPFIERKSDSRTDNLAKISVDELVIRGSEGETASQVQLRVKLHTDNPKVTPVVRYLHGTLKNTLDEQSIPKVFKDEVNTENLDKRIDVPKFSQMIRDPRTANSICSPTTITMMMNWMGEELLPEEVAQNTYDNKYGFGNWAFAAASLGSYGYKAYVDYTNVEGLKQEIAKGYPVGVSVRYSNKPGDNYYIEGAPGYTPGHLIVVTGFTTINGEEYVLVNDSYAPENETVARQYKLEQFERAWVSKAAYIIREKEANAGKEHTERIKAKLVETDVQGEYQVFVGDENINVQDFGGSIAYTTDGNNMEFDQRTYKYFPKIKDKNTLTFTEEEINSPHFALYVITDIGYVYVATK